MIGICRMILRLAGAGVAGLYVATISVSAAENEFATSEDWRITAEEFVYVMQDAISRRFYHGSVPEQELARFQREVGRQLVERKLAADEAARRGLKPDLALLAARLAKSGIDPSTARPENLSPPELFAYRLVNDRLLAEALEMQIKSSIPKPTQDQVKQFYLENQDLFTEPGRYLLSVILLKVNPWESSAVWEATADKGRAIYEDLVAQPEKFSEYAKSHSNDRTAPQGGDMGYQHIGSLSPAIEEALAGIDVGMVTPPIRVLEGIVILHLREKRDVELHPLPEVRDRAEGLYVRNNGEKAWKNTLRDLEQSKKVHINEGIYLPLAD